MKFHLSLFFLLFCLNYSWSQGSTSDNLREDGLNVFLDCDFCDTDYLKNEINYVNYVRDRMVAQVHILATSQRTGAGGREYTFNFIGQLDFDGQMDTLSVATRVDATSDERRESRMTTIEKGLMQFVAQTSLIEYMSINVPVVEDTTTEEIVDKWDFWVFRVSGNGWFNGEELFKSKSFNGSISGNRITEKWKFENWGNFGYNENRYELDSVTTIINSNQNYYFETSAVRAINDHWSAGMVASINSSTFSNIDFRTRLSPAIEYNIFRYPDFNTKQIRFQYRVGYNSFEYVDTTIYNQINENMFNHSISMAAEFVQKWGTFSFDATASQYLHDTSLNRLSLWGRVSWRIIKGLSFNANGGLDFIRDQISLPKGGASDIEILTQQRLLATQYSYWGSIGVSYTFGSIYNNIVNPRFGN